MSQEHPLKLAIKLYNKGYTVRHLNRDWLIANNEKGNPDIFTSQKVCKLLDNLIKQAQVAE